LRSQGGIVETVVGKTLSQIGAWGTALPLNFSLLNYFSKNTKFGAENSLFWEKI